MPIKIQKVDELYTAEMTSPADEHARWSAPRPVARDELIATLRRLGCHQTDIADAFYDVDPEWLSGGRGVFKA
jgi:hypothetical protein